MAHDFGRGWIQLTGRRQKHLHDFSDVGDVDGCTRAIAGGEATPERLALARRLYERACGVLAAAPGLAA